MENALSPETTFTVELLNNIRSNFKLLKTVSTRSTRIDDTFETDNLRYLNNNFLLFRTKILAGKFNFFNNTGDFLKFFKNKSFFTIGNYKKLTVTLTRYIKPKFRNLFI